MCFAALCSPASPCMMHDRRNWYPGTTTLPSRVQIASVNLCNRCHVRKFLARSVHARHDEVTETLECPRHASKRLKWVQKALTAKPLIGGDSGIGSLRMQRGTLGQVPQAMPSQAYRFARIEATCSFFFPRMRWYTINVWLFL